MKLFIDIETIPSQREDYPARVKSKLKPPGSMKKPETIQKWWDNDSENTVNEKVVMSSLDGTYGEILSITWALDNSRVEHLIRDYKTDSESSLLHGFFSNLESDLRSRKITKWIGHNTMFDVKFIFQRSIVNSVIPTVKIPGTAKPWDNCIVDLSQIWSRHGERVSQDNLCYALGYEGKPSDIDGSKVWEYAQAGRFDEIGAYNIDDVEKLRANYKRIEPYLI